MGTPKVQCRWYTRFDYSVRCTDGCRIYTRSKDKSRGFVAVGWYCPGHRIFWPNKAIERNKRFHEPSRYERYELSLKAIKAKGHKITPKEAGLRTRIRNLNELYESCFRWCDNNWDEDKDYSSWSQELTEKFLNLPPTPFELIDVLFSEKLIYHIDSQNHHRMKGWAPNPDKPEWMKWDPKEFNRLLKQDALKQKEMMEQIIESRTKIPIAQVD